MQFQTIFILGLKQMVKEGVFRWRWVNYRVV